MKPTNTRLFKNHRNRFIGKTTQIKPTIHRNRFSDRQSKPYILKVFIAFTCRGVEDQVNQWFKLNPNISVKKFQAPDTGTAFILYKEE